VFVPFHDMKKGGAVFANLLPSTMDETHPSAKKTHDNFDMIQVGTNLLWILSSGERHGSCFVLGQPAAHDSTLFRSRPTTRPRGARYVWTSIHAVGTNYSLLSTRIHHLFEVHELFPMSQSGWAKKKYGKVFFIKIICVANLTSTNPMPTKATRDLAVCLPAPRSLDCAGGADVVCETTCRTNVGSFSNLEM
jgi:hypothetical protein